MSNILIYVDQGVDGASLKQTVKSLKKEIDEKIYSLRKICADEIKQSYWKKEACLLVVPGGRDVFYHQKLGEDGAREIKDFVFKGGSYLGICAGAYFGCSEIEFEKGSKLEVCDKRRLAFFPGLAKGSAYGNHKYAYDSFSGAMAALLSWNGRSFYSYFNGGCSFENAEKLPGISVLSQYLHLEEKPAAIISCLVGKGKAVLSGVHLEYQPEFCNNCDPFLQKIHPFLELSHANRAKVFREILISLNIKLKI